jgi:hypothetical protein
MKIHQRNDYLLILKKQGFIAKNVLIKTQSNYSIIASSDLSLSLYHNNQTHLIMNNNTKGILGLIAVAAGALGLYKYKKMSPEEKAALKDKARKAGDTLKESYNEVEDQVSEKLTSLKNALERETAKAKNSVNRNIDHAEDVIDITAENIEKTVKS